MNVLIVAPFCSLPGEPYFNRFLYLAQNLAKENAVSLVTSRFRHFDKSFRNAETEDGSTLRTILIDEIGYHRNVSLRRLWSHATFVRNFIRWFEAASARASFDLVYSAFPLLSTNIYLGKVKEKYGFQLVIDVQDVWPESISAVIPIISRLPARFVPFSNRADAAYRAADGLLAVSRTYLNRALRANPNVPSLAIYIGSDFALIESISPRALTPSCIHFVYIGTLSYSYDLETVIRGFNLLQMKAPHFRLHIVGGGPDERKLRALAGKNCTFHGFLPYTEMIAIAKGADILVNPIASSAAASVTNKLSDYILIGKPIINSQQNEEVLSLLESLDSLNYRAGDINDFVSAAIRIVNDSSTKRSQLQVLRSAFDRRVSYTRIEEFLKRLTTRQAAGDHSD